MDQKNEIRLKEELLKREKEIRQNIYVVLDN